MAKMLKSTHEGELPLGNKELSCAVLEDGTRVLTATAVFMAFDRPRKGKSSEEYRADRMPSFINANNLQPFVSEDVKEWTELISYRDLNGNEKQGYDARILRGLCKVYIDARNAGELHATQERFAHIAEVLLYALSDIGITALVDEATGYQYDRERDELQKILKQYISEYLLPWQQRFPHEFYKEIFRLNGWDYTIKNLKQRPGVVGKWTNKYIYEQLPKGVLEELKKLTPKDSDGKRKHQYHRLLSEDTGHSHLDRQLASIITIMRLSKDWNDFDNKFNQLYGQQMLDFPEENEEEMLSDFNQNLKKGLGWNPKENN
ncbi:P63C domain-containing protein [Flagellimonas sp. SN16]|jgi:hypothetical protein|uniref:P63C domain-containing protein n=1 Tax=Flagellimonas sp. SN16 TaxID=3415142 RepID=UPI000E2815B3